MVAVAIYSTKHRFHAPEFAPDSLSDEAPPTVSYWRHGCPPMEPPLPLKHLSSTHHPATILNNLKTNTSPDFQDSFTHTHPSSPNPPHNVHHHRPLDRHPGALESLIPLPHQRQNGLTRIRPVLAALRTGGLADPLRPTRPLLHLPRHVG